MSQFDKSFLQQVENIARLAGNAILEIYEDPDKWQVVEKEDDSPLTKADLASHHIIVDALNKLTPDIPLLSEESAIPDYSERKNWSRYWIIDPLDGTKEFVKRNGEFTVNIALVDNHRPVLGVVYVPVKDIMYSGAKGLGAFKGEASQVQSIQTRKMSEREGDIVVVASRRHGTEMLDHLLKRIEEKVAPCELANMGSSLKFCLIAEGKADIYPRLAPTSEWDTAAAQAVLCEAGGEVYDPLFDPFQYNRKDDILNPHFYAVADPEFNWEAVISASE